MTGALNNRFIDLILLMVAGVAVWQAIHIAVPFALTSPAETAVTAWKLLVSERFWPHAAETGKALVYALSLAGKRRLIARAPGALTVMDVAPDGHGALVNNSVPAAAMWKFSGVASSVAVSQNGFHEGSP